MPQEVKEERWHRFMKKQQAISARRQKRKVGTRLQVLIDEVDAAGRQGPQQGRRAGDRRRRACREPAAAARSANSRTVKIERADEYDLYGTAVGF